MFRIQRVSREEAEIVAMLINKAYAQQARLLQITQSSCPAYIGFETKEHVEEAILSGYEIFVLYKGDIPIGTIRYLVDKNNSCKGYINRLAILPKFCNQQYGTALMEFAEIELYKRAVKRIEISIIKQFKVIENFYVKRGYKIKTDLLTARLPYEVRYMELDLQKVISEKMNTQVNTI